MKKNRKYGSIQHFILAGVICFSSPVYADFVFPNTIYNEAQKPDFSKGAISVETVLEANQKYTAGIEKETVFKIFSEKSEPMIMTTDDGVYYAVIDEDGEYSYRIYSHILEMSSDTEGIFLQSCIDYGYISLDLPEQEVRKFLYEKRELKKKLRENNAYILEYLDESDYGGAFYDMSEGKMHIYLVNEKRREELEKKGFVCDTVSDSLKDKYEIMKKLWNQKEALGIFDIHIEETGIIIYGTNIQEEFKEKMGNLGFDIPYQYVRSVWEPFGFRYYDEQSLAEGDEIKLLEYLEMDLEKIEDFVRCFHFVGWRFVESIKEEEWQKLKESISVFQQKYPEYSCRNIYYHVAGDYDADVYMSFDNELLEFVDTLPEYEADKNVVVEYEYGDPQRLELKRMLKQYKEKFPELSYNEIYEIYIREMEENKGISKEEKLYWYLWKKYSGEAEAMNIKSMETETSIDETIDKQPLFSIIAGCGILTVFCGIIICLKEKRKQ